MPPTMVGAAESTANVNTSQHVRDVDDQLHYLNPNAAPFTLLSRKADKSATDNPKAEWGEKERAPKYDQANGAQTAGDVTIEVDNPKYFSVGDIVKVPRTGEVFRVSAVNAADLTAVRGVGSTAAAAMNDNEDLFIIGSSHPENAPVPSPKSHQEVMKYNLTEIFRTAFGASRTQQNTKAYWGNNRKRQRREKSMEHLIDIESAWLFGERNEDTSNVNQPRRYSGGFYYWVTTNVKDAGGTLTEPEVWDWCEDLFAYTAGSDRRVVFASALCCTVFDLLAASRLQTVPSDETYGISIKQWVTSHGTLMIAKHRLLTNGAGGQGYGGDAIAVEPDNIGMRFLANSDTKFYQDRQAPGDDGWLDEFLTEACLIVRLEKLHGRLKGVTG